MPYKNATNEAITNTYPNVKLKASLRAINQVMCLEIEGCNLNVFVNVVN